MTEAEPESGVSARTIASALCWTASVPISGIVVIETMWLFVGSRDLQTTVPSWQWLGAIALAALVGSGVATLARRVHPRGTVASRCLLALIAASIVELLLIQDFHGTVSLASTPPDRWPEASIVTRLTYVDHDTGTSEFAQARQVHEAVLEPAMGRSIDDVCESILSVTDANPDSAAPVPSPCSWSFATRADGDALWVETVDGEPERIAVTIYAGPIRA